MSRPARYTACVLLIVILVLAIGCNKSELSADNPVDGWAVLAEKDDYNMRTDLSVDYINISRMRQALEKSGWNPEQIHDVHEFDRDTLQTELDWLEENADENDIVILYVSAHGDYLLSEWVFSRKLFASEWAQIPSHRRLLVIDSCNAARDTSAVASDPSPHLSIAAVAASELGWAGLEEEGLPIIGGVFTHYFTDALDNPDADADGDGLVSVQEAAMMAEGEQRAYLHDVVLVVPEFVEMYHDLGEYPEQDPAYPHVVVDDALGEPLHLVLDAYR